MTNRARFCMSLSKLFDYMISWWLQTDIELHKNYNRVIIWTLHLNSDAFWWNIDGKAESTDESLVVLFYFASVIARAQWGVTIFTDISLWTYYNKCTYFLICLRHANDFLMCVHFSAVGGYYFFLKFILSDIYST